MINLLKLNKYRDVSPEIIDLYGHAGDHSCGAFWFPSPIDQKPMRVIASCGEGWDHVSVSRQNRCPNWIEMDRVKRSFFKEHEVCMQLHVAEKDHISVCHNCLHIWRPHDTEIPLPPSIMVA